MIWVLLRRGLAAGLAAGVLAGAFGLVMAEPSLEGAIAFEERLGDLAGGGRQQARPEPPAPAPVSREAQRAGLIAASGLYGLSMGGLFALAFAAMRGRVRTRGDRALSLWLAAVAFLVVVLVPFLKYPANPPAVGDAETIGSRTALYVVMVAISALAAFAAWRTAHWLGRVERPRRLLMTAGVFLATVGLAFALMPSVDEVPAAFPAPLLRDFRLVSLGTQLVLWGALGTLFGLAVARPRDGVGGLVMLGLDRLVMLGLDRLAMLGRRADLGRRTDLGRRGDLRRRTGLGR